MLRRTSRDKAAVRVVPATTRFDSDKLEFYPVLEGKRKTKRICLTTKQLFTTNVIHRSEECPRGSLIRQLNYRDRRSDANQVLGSYWHEA
jgi:hypothetical protein